METINQIGRTIGRENDPSSFSDTVIDKSVDTLTDNQNLSTTCGIGQAKCLLSSPTTSDFSSKPDNECLVSNKIKITTLFNNFKFTMLLQYSKECLGFIAIILTTYATLLNKEPVIGGTTSPKPIFSLHSIVQEWPYGNLVDVQSKVAVSELSLIFFYAPWCAESLHAKKVYNSVANLYSEEVYFAAVNCWQPNSGCRALYSNVYKWPVLMAYLPNVSVQYNGDWNVQSLSKFIEGLLMPIVRIHNKKEILHLRIANDGVVFGLFNSCDSKEYQIFFQTAIKWLVNDSYQYTKFAVYVGEDTSMFLHSELIKAPVIKLFTQNDTTIYSKSKWTSKNIINFVRHQLADSTIWINLPSIKSATMHTYLQRGPILLMFSPRVSPSNDYLIMKQLIYSYNNYRIDLNTSVLNEYISDIKKEYPVMLKKLNNFCDFSKKIQHQGIQAALFDVKLCGDSLFSMGAKLINTSKQVSSSYPKCIDEVNKNNVQSCEESLYPNSYFKRNTNTLDDQTPSNLLRRQMQKQCVSMEKLPNQLFEKGVLEPLLPTYEYKNNRTLKFLMLDSMVHIEYLRNFMGDLKTPEISLFPTTKLFIIDNDREILHMHKGPVSSKSALEFVNEFYNGKLNRHLRSFGQMENKNNSVDDLLISLKEINYPQFLKVINRTNVTSVVLFHTAQCSLCYLMSQALLQVSHIIKLKNVKFYRIDASANEMYWEYTMDKLPKLIIFPKNRSGDSNVFLSSLQISVKNVFSFILSNLNPEQQLHSLINSCMSTKLNFAFQSCVAQVRVLINNEISHQLQNWNYPSGNQTRILTRLKALKGIYIELLRSRKTEDLTLISKEISKYGNI